MRLHEGLMPGVSGVQAKVERMPTLDTQHVPVVQMPLSNTGSAALMYALVQSARHQQPPCEVEAA